MWRRFQLIPGFRSVILWFSAALLLGSSAVVSMMHLPAQAGYQGVYTVQSNSMVPELRPGDVIYLDEVDPERIQVGDVITYRMESVTDSKLITHRVVEIRGQEASREFRTKGDALESTDGWKSQDRVIGRVEHSFSKLGTLYETVSSPLGVIALILAPSASILLLEMEKIYEELSPSRDREGAFQTIIKEVQR